MSRPDAPDDSSVDHELSDSDANVHHVWDNSLDPVLTVESGDVVRFECRDALNGQIGPGSTAADLSAASSDPVHPLTGPVRVEGASPGDVLVIEFLDFEHEGWGFTGFHPGEKGMGLLPEAFPDGDLHVWDLDGDVGRFVNGIEVPLDPFPGVAGVAPAADGEHSTTPPRDAGGNLDVKHLTAGSTLYLPVEVEDALFSTGDCHAAQGDGEVCVEGIEAPMSVTAQLNLRSDLSVEQPQFETSGPFAPSGREGPAYATTGVADDLTEAAKSATRHMIDHLREERGLTRGEAYILCSAAADLKVNQIVNAPNWTVSAYVSQRLFPD